MRLIKVYVVSSPDLKMSLDPVTNGVVPRDHIGTHIGDNKDIVMTTNANVWPYVAVSDHRPILIRYRLN